MHQNESMKLFEIKHSKCIQNESMKLFEKIITTTKTYERKQEARRKIIELLMFVHYKGSFKHFPNFSQMR